MLLRQLLSDGRSLAGCPVQTSEGVKAVDVAWVSQERRKSRPNDPAYLIAPEICVEVQSPSNTQEELTERKALFFEKGAQEFWLCNVSGQMTFSDPGGEIPQSKLCPGFPMAINRG